MAEFSYISLDNLKAKALEFRASWENAQRTYNGLDTEGKKKFEAEYGAMQTKANAILKTLASIGGAYDKTVKTVSDVFSFFSSDNKLNGLGIAPIVSGAIIAGSVATMSYFITDAINFSNRMKTFNGLVEQKELTPSQAADIVERMEGGGGVFGVSFASPLKKAVTVASLAALSYGGYKFYQYKTNN